MHQVSDIIPVETKSVATMPASSNVTDLERKPGEMVENTGGGSVAAVIGITIEFVASLKLKQLSLGSTVIR